MSRGHGLRAMRKRIRHFLVKLTITYWVVVFLAWLLRTLPERLALWLGRTFGGLFYYLNFRHRPVCLANLRIAFPEKSEAERRKIARACYRHIGQSVAEFARFPKIDGNNIHKYLDRENMHIVDGLLKEGRGVIAVTGHIGMWEMTGFGTSCMGYPLDSVARPIDAPRINEFVEKLRRSRGQRIVNKQGAMIQILKSLKEGRIFGLLMDQKAGSDSLYVPFFGKPAPTLDIAARLHLRIGSPIIVATSYRTGKGFHHSMRIRGPLRFELTGDEKEDIRIITAACNAALEEAIREHPEQWLWMHRRWKDRKSRREGGASGPGPDGDRGERRSVAGSTSDGVPGVRTEKAASGYIAQDDAAGGGTVAGGRCPSDNAFMVSAGGAPPGAGGANGVACGGASDSIADAPRNFPAGGVMRDGAPGARNGQPDSRAVRRIRLAAIVAAIVPLIASCLRHSQMSPEAAVAVRASPEESAALTGREYLIRKACSGTKGERMDAIAVMAAIGDPSFIPVLEDRLRKEDDRFMQIAIMEDMAATGDQRAVRPIKRIMA
ncbi:MAG: lysophospholipid acyltransferase family protein, partial [Planctomycetota bacterium]|nr:lysophospholipid acyltransferase family protein [Planctomycetota bacterium]